MTVRGQSSVGGVARHLREKRTTEILRSAQNDMDSAWSSAAALGDRGFSGKNYRDSSLPLRMTWTVRGQRRYAARSMAGAELPFRAAACNL